MSEESRHRLLLAGVLLAAFALRAGWVLLATLDPSDGTYYDMAWYHLTALRIAGGHGITRIDGAPTAVWPPLYPALLALVYSVSGASFLAGKLVNAFYGAFTAFFIYAIGSRLMSRRAGLFAAALFAVCPDDVFFSNFVMSEAAFGTIFTGSLWLFTVLNQRRPEAGLLAWFLYGGTLGLATLTRGIALAWLLVPFGVWLAAARSLRRSLPKLGIAALGLACVLAPWTIRNTVRMGYPILVASSLGRTLAHAHSPFETGGPSLKTFVYRRRLQKPFEHLPQPEREVAIMRAYIRTSLGYMFTHPGHELRVLPHRVYHLFKHGHVGLEIGRPTLDSGEMKPFFGPAWHRALAALADACFAALLILGLLGLPRCLRSPDRTALLVPLGIAYFTLFHLILFPADPRYHLPLLPLLALSAGGLLGRQRKQGDAPLDFRCERLKGEQHAPKAPRS